MIFGDSNPKPFSLAGGILKLLLGGEIFIGSIILAFTIIFPIIKFRILFALMSTPNRINHGLLTLLANSGKWSMLDVFVIAVIVVAFKGFPGGSYVRLNIGIYLFAASVLLNMYATKVLKTRFSAIDH